MERQNMIDLKHNIITLSKVNHTIVENIISFITHQIPKFIFQNLLIARKQGNICTA